jgi:hypothetical protein
MSAARPAVETVPLDTGEDTDVDRRGDKQALARSE